MGTNYDWIPDDTCPHCGRSGDPKHIGKSSGGWAFALHVYPDEGIDGLRDWYHVWHKQAGHIQDEYGSTLSVDEMMRVITRRGPNLQRHEVDGHSCIGHGDRDYDLHVGEFS